MTTAATPVADLEAKLIALLEDFTQDWDTAPDGGITGESRLLADLGFESIDVIQFMVAVEEDIAGRKLPFNDLVMKDGRYVDDLSVRQMAVFLTKEGC
ncbi:MAG: hypothetical protein ABF296_00430 [Oceanococcaceae bacterium]